MGMRSMYLWSATLALLHRLLLDLNDTTFQFLDFGAKMRQCGFSAQHQLLVVPLALREALRRGVHGGSERPINGLHGRAEIGN